MAVPCGSKCASSAIPFVQLAIRSHLSTFRAPYRTFEFLLPRRQVRYQSSWKARARTLPSARRPTISLSWRVSASLPRSFATSSTNNATVCVQNPQNDEEGNPMMLEITSRAAKRLAEIMKKDKNPDLALRIQVESGGCHGFQYLMSLITIPAKDAANWSSVINEGDSIFQYTLDGLSDAGSEAKPSVILDEPSLDLLKGSKVDFTMELIGSQFKIIDNPYATSSCGCGTSFDIKM